MQNEIYKFIVINNYVQFKYMISNFGNIINTEKENRLIKTPINTIGYKISNLKTNHFKKTFSVHRLVLMTFLGPDADTNNKLVDHINGNKTDNRLCNLRWCSYRENSMNRSVNKRTGVKGVSFNKRSKKYHAYINKKYLGSYENIDDAKRVYNENAIKLFGTYARLNIV